MSDTTPKMRQRLALEICKISVNRWKYDQLDAAYSAVDALLREMMEPNEGMYQAAEMEVSIFQMWQAMIQHILDEGKTVRIPMEGKD